MIPLQELDPIPTKEELIVSLKDTLGKLLREEVTSDIEPERVYQYRQARKNDLYYRGLQYLAPGMYENGLIDYSSVGSPIANFDKDSDLGFYDYVQNIYRGNGRKFIAVLGQRSPNVTAIPDDPNDDSLHETCKNANAGIQILRVKWGADEVNLDLAMRLWKTSTVFVYTRWVADGEKYGYRSEPKIEMVDTPIGPATSDCMNCGTSTPQDDTQPAPPPACPACGAPFDPTSHKPAPTAPMPQTTGVEQYPNGEVECDLYDIFTVSCPYYTKKLINAPWLMLEMDEHRGKLIAAYPQLRDENDGDRSNALDSASSSYGVQARDTASSPSGSPQPNRTSRWSYRRLWLRPHMYELVKDSAMREMLQKYHPTGAKCVFVNGELVDLDEERLDEVWTAIKPETSEYIFADGVGQDLVQIQDLVNDTLNIGVETFERGIPRTLADPRVFDFRQEDQKTARPAEVVPTLPNSSGTLADAFFQLPAAQMPQGIEQWVGAVQAQAEQAVGITPPIWGGDEGSQTAREAEIKKNAALQSLGTTWQYIRVGWKGVYWNGLQQMAKYGVGNKKANVDGQSVLLNMAALQAEGYHLEADEAIPLTWGQQRDYLMYMMTLPPPVLQGWGFQDPRNIEPQSRLLGMTGWFTPNLDDIQKVQGEIQELLKAAPVQQPDPQTGQMQLLPSIPPDGFEDNHPMVVQWVKEWCQTAAGLAAKKQNPNGYKNVVAWGKAHLQMIAPPPPPPPPKHPPGPPGAPAGMGPQPMGPSGPPPPGAMNIPPGQAA